MSVPAWFGRVAVRRAAAGFPEPIGFLPDPAGIPADEDRLRPLYARVLGLSHLDPGGLLCFAFFEGTLILAFLLALAELISWWGLLILPASVAVMVKVNDLVAAAVARSAARVPELEQERFRRELQPVVGRATVPGALAYPMTVPVPTGRQADRAGVARFDADRAAAGAEPGSAAVARVRPELATPRTRPRPVADAARTGAPPAVEPAASGLAAAHSGRSGLNAHSYGRLDSYRRPDQRSARIDARAHYPADAAEQRLRQSAHRRYE
ncbi:hypothetical protein [Solwaraspora sp. WMMD1047]|uniref:hypothetical protein n=1 Tax=Solwaraspora sp. WMMD1047 TaxID=3016102 RepID=UPI003242A703